MKNIMACYALLSALSPFALQAMDAPQTLSHIERQLVVREIQNTGMQTVLDQTNDPNFQTLTIKGKFERESNDPLAKNMFNEINSIEAQPRVSPAPRNYLGQHTRYYFFPSNNPNKITITAQLSNKAEIQQICARYDQ